MSILLTAASGAVNKVNANAKSTINRGVNKVNGAFTDVNATVPKFGGGVSHFFRCAAPRSILDSWWLYIVRSPIKNVGRCL